MRDKYKVLIDSFNNWNITLSDEQLFQFDKYYELLIEWNEKMNLTAITDFDEVVKKHFIDSVSLAAFTDLNAVSSIIDVGTGAGFPGIPLKIVFPHLRVTLLDSLNKRLTFLNCVIDELKLDNIQTVHGRAEDVSRENTHRESYDFCVSRAVANLSTLTELCSPFVKLNGFFIAYKSEKADEEIANAKKAFHLLGCSLDRVEAFELFDNSRNILFIAKKEKTSKKYPRKAGTPAKQPL